MPIQYYLAEGNHCNNQLANTVLCKIWENVFHGKHSRKRATALPSTADRCPSAHSGATGGRFRPYMKLWLEFHDQKEVLRDFDITKFDNGTKFVSKERTDVRVSFHLL